jgi:hypothetical protein
MSKHNKHGRQAPIPWQPMERAVPIPFLPEQVAKMREHAVELGHTAADVDRVVAEGTSAEVWRDDEGAVRMLSIRRVDRKAIRDWRHLQRIKNDVAGPEVEAIELFPAESRLVDTANQYWLWVLPPAEHVPVGFEQGRVVSENNDGPWQQRPGLTT